MPSEDEIDEIRRAMVEQRVTQGSLADKIGYKQSTISHALCGLTCSATLAHAIKAELGLPSDPPPKKRKIPVVLKPRQVKRRSLADPAAVDGIMRLLCEQNELACHLTPRQPKPPEAPALPPRSYDRCGPKRRYKCTPEVCRFVRSQIGRPIPDVQQAVLERFGWTICKKSVYEIWNGTIAL